MFRVALLVGCFYGLTAVILGAMGAHALQDKLTPKLLNSFSVGARYQLMHAVLLVGLGLWARSFSSTMIHAAIGLIIVGVLLFSGSIYVLVLLRWKVGIVTPIGGLCMIIGWALMFVAALQIKG